MNLTWSWKRHTWPTLLGLAGILALWWMVNNLLLPWATVGKSTVVPFAVSYAKVSPDGRYVAVAANDGKLFCLDIASGERREIGSVGESGTIARTIWSPDSRYVAFPDESYTVRTYDTTNNETRVVAAVGLLGTPLWTRGGELALHPQGKHPSAIYGVREQGAPQPLFSADTTMVVVNINGGLSLALRGIPGSARELLALDRPGGTPRVVQSGISLLHAASPDGTLWVYNGKEHRLMLAGIDRAPVDLGLDSTYYASYDANWSPNGKWLAVFAQIQGAGSYDLLLFDQSGKEHYRQRFASRGVANEFWWRSDSRMFGFSTYHQPIESQGTDYIDLLDLERLKLREWQLPHDGRALELGGWADERTVYGVRGSTLYRFDLR